MNAMFRLVRVAGDSMQPSIQSGRLLLVESVSYRIRPPRRGEVVVVQHPHEERRLLKRIAAVPGDVLPDGRLGADEYVVLGDHLDASVDSRRFGRVRRDHILGRALL